MARTVIRHIIRIHPEKRDGDEPDPDEPFHEKGPEWKNGSSAPGKNRIANQMLAKPTQRG